MGTQENEHEGKLRTGTTLEDWYHSMDSNVAEQIESLRSGIQSLASTVDRMAKEQMPHPHLRAIGAVNEAEAAVKRNPLSALAITRKSVDLKAGCSQAVPGRKLAGMLGRVWITGATFHAAKATA